MNSRSHPAKSLVGVLIRPDLPLQSVSSLCWIVVPQAALEKPHVVQARGSWRFVGCWLGLGLLAGSLGSGCGDRPTERRRAPSAARTPAGRTPPAAPAPAGGQIDGHRGRPHVGRRSKGPIDHTPGTQPVPVHGHRPDSGVDFEHVSGMTARSTSRPPTARASRSSTTTTTACLDLYFASFNPDASRDPRARPEPAVSQPGRGRFEDVTDAAGVGFQGHLPRRHRRRPRQRRRSGLVLCNYGPNVLYLNNGDGTFTRRQQAGSGIGPSRLVLRRRSPRLRQRRRPRPLRLQLRRLELPRGRQVLRRRRRRTSASTARPARSADASTSSTATTATAPSPTSPTTPASGRRGLPARPRLRRRHRRPRTATASSTSTSPTT